MAKLNASRIQEDKDETAILRRIPNCHKVWSGRWLGCLAVLNRNKEEISAGSENEFKYFYSTCNFKHAVNQKDVQFLLYKISLTTLKNIRLHMQ